MNKVVCPNCKKEIEITEAISHKIQEDVLNKAKIEFGKQLEEQRKEIQEKAGKRIRETMQLEFKDSQNELEESKEQKAKNANPGKPAIILE